MSKEIERKFLVVNDSWKGQSKGIEIKQGYISKKEGQIVRIRLYGDKAYICIKGRNKGIERDEFEYQIPYKDGKYILENFVTDSIIEKKRYKIQYKGNIWEIDEFFGDNKGLIVAEIELKSENQRFEKPIFVGEEVTSQKKYINSNLIENPFTKW